MSQLTSTSSTGTAQPAHQSSSGVPAHLQAHAQALQQGFQLYAGLKTGGVGSPLSAATSSSSAAAAAAAAAAVSNVAAHSAASATATSNVSATSGVDVATAISLKTSAAEATGMVPGSAFNFGPTPGSLGLYGDQAAAAAASSYLDQFRDASNPYYMPPAPAPAHRNSASDASAAEKAQSALNPGASAAAASAYPFLAAHTTPRGTPYSFMHNTGASQLADPNSQLYSSYLRREDFLMFNQGLLGRGAGAAGYGQPPPPTAYRPSSLGMPKPYDINRSWF
ncbi:PREDICTED: homeobox protein Hox-A13-like [Rhagoletis zephyria]|nr:PREDICTED: homeobox protein Hox-A13-like [Rhagoletis zephyria]